MWRHERGDWGERRIAPVITLGEERAFGPVLAERMTHRGGFVRDDRFRGVS
tara:strand:- start:593 stop:745 length:153 start_codon:yes stop_codon:yes gene_type:complete